MIRRLTLVGALLALTVTCAVADDFHFFPTGYGNPSRPEIGADFGQRVRVETIRFYIDNQDVTGRAQLGDYRAVFQPQYDIDPGAHTVMLQATGMQGGNLQRSWGFSVGNNNNNNNNNWNNNGNNNPSNVTQLTPFPNNGSSTGRRPDIGVALPAGVSRNNFQFTIDGRDFSRSVMADGDRIFYRPDYDLDMGQHRASFTGYSGGERIEQNWEFYVR